MKDVIETMNSVEIVVKEEEELFFYFFKSYFPHAFSKNSYLCIIFSKNNKM